MLDLEASHKALSRVHHAFVDEGMPAALRARELSVDLSRYSAEQIEWALSAWQMRTLDEYRSQVGFSEFLLELTELGLPFDALGTAARVVRDEAVHVELCRRMVKALGGSDQIPGTPQFHRSDKQAPLLQRVLTNIVGSLCIGETFSARMIAAVREHTEDPTAHAVFTQLLRDEALHGRFGWYLLELLTPHLSSEQKDYARKLIPSCLLQVHEAMRPEKRNGRALNPFGDLPSKQQQRVYRDTLARDIVPAFARLGF